MEKRGGTGRKKVTGAGEDGERERGRSVVDWVDWKIRIGWRIQASGSMPNVVIRFQSSGMSPM